MNRWKKTAYLMALLLIILGVGGCMKTKKNDEEVVNLLKEYAQEQYQETFTVVSVERAVDRTRRDVVYLSSQDGYIFAVYHEGDDDKYENLYDDYKLDAIDSVFEDALDFSQYFSDSLVQCKVMPLIYPDDSVTVQELKEKTLEEYRKEYEFSKMICVLKIRGEKGFLEEHVQAVYEAYQMARTISPKHIDFEVVVSDTDEEFDFRMETLRNAYTGEWEKYTGTKEYLSLIDVNVNSAEELLPLIKEVR